MYKKNKDTNKDLDNIINFVAIILKVKIIKRLKQFNLAMINFLFLRAENI